LEEFTLNVLSSPVLSALFSLKKDKTKTKRIDAIPKIFRIFTSSGVNIGSLEEFVPMLY
jgi:hypothetical protein